MGFVSFRVAFVGAFLLTLWFQCFFVNLDLCKHLFSVASYIDDAASTMSL